MPLGFNEIYEGMNNLKLHSKIWKEGFMFQKGGDSPVQQLINLYIGLEKAIL